MATPTPVTSPAQVVTTEASVIVEDRSPAEVWAFIRPAESALLTNADTLRAFTVPGTGPGVGEEQCFVTLADGAEHVGMIRVTDEQSAAFAEAVTTNSQVPQRSRWEVEQVEGGTKLVARSWTELPAGLTAAWLDDYRQKSQMAQERYVRRVKTLLESGVAVGSSDSGQ